MTFDACIAGGGVAVFPADTVYGLACDALNPDAVARLYALKGRPPDKPAAVMFFSLAPALAALRELGPRTRGALERLLPGAVTLLLPNPEGRFPLACGPDPRTLGLRVPDLPMLAAVAVPVLQSSANASGGGDARDQSNLDLACDARRGRIVEDAEEARPAQQERVLPGAEAVHHLPVVEARGGRIGDPIAQLVRHELQGPGAGLPVLEPYARIGGDCAAEGVDEERVIADQPLRLLPAPDGGVAHACLAEPRRHLREFLPRGRNVAQPCALERFLVVVEELTLVAEWQSDSISDSTSSV
jgi:tRNA threonylcarbamoyl adenosine modification protein (Sua5/YciO/YrdC/YwlC family)